MYDPGRTTFPTTEQVRIGRTVTELVRFWQGATVDEMEQHDSAPAKFALVVPSPGLLVLAYKFGTLEWSDAPFQAHRVTTVDPGWPAGGPDEGLVLRTLLVDARSGRIMAMRHDAWSAGFANAVRVAVAEQLISEPDDEAAGRSLDELYARYRTPAALARAGCATCATNGPIMAGPGASVNFY